jgi:hypothetical protein
MLNVRGGPEDAAPEREEAQTDVPRLTVASTAEEGSLRPGPVQPAEVRVVVAAQFVIRAQGGPGPEPSK